MPEMTSTRQVPQLPTVQPKSIGTPLDWQYSRSRLPDGTSKVSPTGSTRNLGMGMVEGRLGGKPQRDRRDAPHRRNAVARCVTCGRARKSNRSLARARRGAPYTRAPVTSRTGSEPHVVVLTAHIGAPPIDDPVGFLARCAAGSATCVERATDALSLGRVLRAALAFTGADPAVEPGRGSALEWTGEHWRLVSHNAIDPLHGLSGDEGIGRPVP